MPVPCDIIPICGRIQSHVIVCAAAAATISLSLQQIPRRDLKIEETRGDEPAGPTEEEPAFRSAVARDAPASPAAPEHPLAGSHRSVQESAQLDVVARRRWERRQFGSLARRARPLPAPSRSRRKRWPP